jgi:mRNA interferase RelE/StbE
MKVIISPRAEKQLRKLPKIDQLAVAIKIRSIKDISSAISGEDKLSGYKNIFRVRLGNCRVVYRKSGGEMYIVLISHRKDIYQLVKQLFG